VIDPAITNAPIDIVVEIDYTGQNISWTATDVNPYNYTIELQGTGIVTGPEVWISGVAVTYNIPDGFNLGDYIYTVNFTDDGGNSITNSVTFAVEDTIAPIITSVPSNISAKSSYSGLVIIWAATDLNPETYTIERNGTEIVGPTAWTSGEVIVYSIPDGLDIGVYTYSISFTDGGGNSITDSVTFAVEETTCSDTITFTTYETACADSTICITRECEANGITSIIILVSIVSIVIVKRRKSWNN
jgi:hypothetical protein